MDKNFLLIQTNDIELLKSTLSEFADLYRDQQFSQPIRLFQSKSNICCYLVIFPKGINSEYLMYAVNYIHYPVNHAKFEFVRGFLVENKTKSVLFVPDFDTECDNCYSIDENGVTTKHSFTGNWSDSEKIIEYQIPNVNLDGFKILSDIEARPKKGLLQKIFGK